MVSLQQHIITQSKTIKDALEQINSLSLNMTLFVVDEKGKMVGALTDGDIRRALLKGSKLDDRVAIAMNTDFKFLKRNNISIEFVRILKEEAIKAVPLLDEDNHILKIIELEKKRSILPLDAVVMAGGEGIRLRPLTNDSPKPLLDIGGKPILELLIDRLDKYGIENIQITVRYLADKIVKHFGNGESRGLSISYVKEQQPLGTIGSLSLIEKFQHSNVLVINADLLTNIDFEDFCKEFLSKNADMAVASVPYHVQIPYATLELDNGAILSFREKPTYTYYSNAGIYLIKSHLLSLIPRNQFFNATDFIEMLIREKCKVISYPILGYWQDIGRMEDYDKAQEDIKHVKDLV